MIATENTQTATISARKPKFTTSHRKEKHGLHQCYAMLAPSRNNDRRMQVIAELRIYWPGSVTVTACLWTTGGDYRYGLGTAGGYGYDKASAAAADAIRNAGFDLSKDIAGVGGSAIQDAMYAIAAALGYPGAMLFETHP